MHMPMLALTCLTAIINHFAAIAEAKSLASRIRVGLQLGMSACPAATGPQILGEAVVLWELRALDGDEFPKHRPLHNGEKAMWFRIRGYESGCDDSDADAWPKIVGAVDGDVKAVCHGTKYSRHCARGRARAMAMQWCTKAWWLDPKLQRLPICIYIYIYNN